MKAQWTDFITLLKREVVPALGCTEPMSVALAAANCRKLLGQDPTRISVWVSGNLFKNGMGVGVPGTGMIGLPVAAAVGITGGNPDAGLEVLKTLTPQQVDAAKALLPIIQVDVKDVPDVLYAEVLAEADGHSARVVICTDHTRIVLLEKDGEVLMEQDSAPGVQIQPAKSDKPAMTLREIVAFALEVPLTEIAFIREAASMNQALADEGLQGYGLRIGKILTEQVERKLLSDDLMTLAMRLSSAASDARMDGAMLPAMSNSGSGNQGIAATMPVVAAARFLKADDEQLARALVMSHLVAIYIKAYQNKLSALCAASTIKEKVLYIYGGANRISDVEPADESMLPRETVIWYDTSNHVVRRKHKDVEGAVRYMGSADGITVIKRSVNYMAVDGEFVVAIQPIYVTLKNSPNARITVKSGVTGQIVIVPESGTIDGQESFSINDQYGKATFVCDGTDWWVG